MPILQNYEVVDISVKKLEIHRKGKDGLVCKDNIRADITVAFYIRVEASVESVRKVAQMLTPERVSDLAQLRELFEAKFSEALKTAGKQMEFHELFTERIKFRDQIQSTIGKDLDGDTYVEPDMVLLNGIVEGIDARKADVDALIEASLQGYTLERLELLLRAILRAGTFEILGHADVHPRVAINDYINVAHGFFSGREPTMVNGVLDRIARNLRPDEMNGGDGGRDTTDRAEG
jgi:transcription antitermination factor NusB